MTDRRNPILPLPYRACDLAQSRKILKSRKVVIRRPQGSRGHTDAAAVGAGRGTGDRPARSHPAGAASGPLGGAGSSAEPS